MTQYDEKTTLLPCGVLSSNVKTTDEMFQPNEATDRLHFISILKPNISCVLVWGKYILSSPPPFFLMEDHMKRQV